MQITRQADYATRAVLFLARHRNGKHIATSQVAKEQSIPSSFLPKIISQLSVAGLLNATRGARGGITLAREPQQITLMEVIEAIDGPIQLNSCVEAKGGCALEGNCALQSVWCDAQNELITKLRNTNFAQLTA
jgi:Rrf2 family protein